MRAGYGDAVPRSLSGRLLGSLVMIFGLMIIALPITVIGTNFSSVYRDFVASQQEPVGRARKLNRRETSIAAAKAQRMARARSNQNQTSIWG